MHEAINICIYKLIMGEKGGDTCPKKQTTGHDVGATKQDIALTEMFTGEMTGGRQRGGMGANDIVTM